MIKRRPTTQYTIGNKELHHDDLHGERFYDWFDKAFNLPSLAEGSAKQGSTHDKLFPASFRGKRFFSQDITIAGIAILSLYPHSCHPCTHHIHTEQSGAIDIPHHPNMTVTTGYSLGEGFEVPSPSSNSHIIEPRASSIVFSHKHHSPAGSGDYSSPIHYNHGRNALI